MFVAHLPDAGSSIADDHREDAVTGIGTQVAGAFLQETRQRAKRPIPAILRFFKPPDKALQLCLLFGHDIIAVASTMEAQSVHRAVITTIAIAGAANRPFPFQATPLNSP